ncbi:MAG: carotenoid biosynthesis protein [Promethearchaeota archaeon]|nr:MAG: carotenoid biosynthesis protein [Candidatus Lokiarchaeota archaeon]
MKLEYDDEFIIIITLIFTPIIIFSTILHHLFPEVLQVPSTLGPYFIEPIWLDLVIMDISTAIMAIIVIYHGFKTQGKFKTTCFLYGSILFAGLEECHWILSGRFNLTPDKTYFFTRGGLWFIEIPVYTCLAWFILAWCCNYVSEVIFPSRNYPFHACIAGLLAVSLDLWMDPVMVNIGSASIYPNSKGLWVWLADPKDTLSIFSIPFFNFLGWFLVIFTFLMLFGYILDDNKIEIHGKTKSAFIFFGLIIVFIGITGIILIVVNFLINPWLRGVDLIPIKLLF